MTLAELVIKMSADTAVLRSDFEKGKKMATDFAASVSQTFNMMGTALGALPFVALNAGFAEIVKHSAEFGDEIARAAEKSGMAAADISALKFAADTSGVGFESLQKAVGIFDRNLVGLGGTSKKFEAALSGIGLATRDMSGNLLPAHDLLLKVADRFSKMPDGAEKSATAMALFGRSGADMIPLLDRGADGIEALEARAKDLGVVLSGPDVESAKLMHTEFVSLQTGLQGLEFDLSSKLFPTLTLGAELFLRNKYAVAEFKDELELLSLGLTAQIESAINFFGMEDEDLDDIARQTTDVFTDQTQQLANLKKGLAELGGAARDTKSDFNIGGGAGRPAEAKGIRDWAEPGRMDFDQGIKEYAKMFDELRLAVTPAQKVLDEFYKREEDIQKLAGAGLDVSALERMNLAKVFQGLDVAQLPGIGAAEGKQQQQAWLTVLPQQITAAIPVLKQAHDAFASLDADAFTFGKEASSAFSQMIIYGRNFEKSLKSLVDLFAQFILKTYVFQGLSKTLGQGNSVGGVLGSFFAGLAGGRAAGGPVNYGQSYMVGESGPEIFTPTTAGLITPNDQSSVGAGGRGGDTITNIDARGSDAGVYYRVLRAQQEAEKRATTKGYLMNREMTLRGN